MSTEKKVMPRYLRRRLNDQTYPLLVIFEEKHGDIHCLINSEEGLMRCFFEAMKGRFEENWYWGEDLGRVAAIIESGDTTESYLFMDEHSDHQYEGFSFENLAIY